jgi:hypothetical protein
VVWTRDGKIHRVRVPLDATGNGTATVDFGHDDVQRVVLTLANTSTRYDCQQGTNYSCRGKPVDAQDDFSYTVSAGRTTP